MRVLVVGAGFAGAVFARTLAESGHTICVIDRRNHLGGNAYDYVDPTGVRIHKYGPHLFHTNNETVVDWLKGFGSFVPYEHCVTVLNGSRYLPLPISRATFEAHFERRFDSDEALAKVLSELTEPKEHPANAAEYLYGVIGRELTDIVFRPYTRKMWGQALEDMDAAVVRRISVQLGYERRYFPGDTFQLLPRDGYARLFASIFDHPRIDVALETVYSAKLAQSFDYVFSSAAIDEHFGYVFGELPYRSIRFHHHRVAMPADPAPTPVVNYSDAGPYTRETFWHMLPRHHVRNTGTVIRTVEEPCDFRDNNRERYYPINDAAGANRGRYLQYKALADGLDNLTFIGRCGCYQYLDMHQVINQSLAGAHHWLERYGPATRDRLRRVATP